MPIGAMAIGIRAKKPAAANPFAPGARKISTYGLRIEILLDFWAALIYIRGV
jgi:hypothetical protein